MRIYTGDSLAPRWELQRRLILSREFKRFRRRYQLTQKDLAQASGVHINTIANCERYGKVTTEDFFYYLQIAKQAAALVEQGKPINKIELIDIPFSEYKTFIETIFN